MGVPADRPIAASSVKAVAKPTYITWVTTTASVASLCGAPTMAVYGMRLSCDRSSNVRAWGRIARAGVLGLVVLCLLGFGSGMATAAAATTTPSTTTSTVTAPVKTVTQTQTTTAPAKTTTVTAPTQTNTVIKTQTTTTPTTTTSKNNAPAAALGAAASRNASKPEESSGLPGWAWALIGAAAVALLVWIVAAIRHRRKETPPGPPGTPPGDGSPRTAPPPL